jgi:hypothetical protein
MKVEVGMFEVIGSWDGLGFTQLPPGLEMHEVQPTKSPIRLHICPITGFQVTSWTKVSLFELAILTQSSPDLTV